MEEALSSSETSVLTRATEDAILLSHCRENLKSYIHLYVLQRVSACYTLLL
jgi:hypothetical protein